jgi:hypothetical protein
MRVTENAVYFWGDWLSNFFVCDIYVANNEVKFHSSEQLFMLNKALHFKDYETADRIRKTTNPKEAKRLGRMVKNFDTNVWNMYCEDYMLHSLKFKFQNPTLRDLLIGTKDKLLVEGSPFDTIWGVGLHYQDDLILDSKNWKGKNLLGKCLMEVREELLTNKNIL